VQDRGFHVMSVPSGNMELTSSAHMSLVCMLVTFLIEAFLRSTPVGHKAIRESHGSTCQTADDTPFSLCARGLRRDAHETFDTRDYVAMCKWVLSIKSENALLTLMRPQNDMMKPGGVGRMYRIAASKRRFSESCSRSHYARGIEFFMLNILPQLFGI
jgi:hypothetical protein